MQTNKHYPPPVVEVSDAVYYSLPVSKETKADALSKAVVFSAEDVRSAWKKSKLGKMALISTNKEYRALPKTVWTAILDLHQTLHQYTPEFFDCDAFSAVFVGFTVWNFEINGVVRVFDNSAGHSYNAILIVSDDGKTCTWEIVEPQIDKLIGDSAMPVVVTHQDTAYTATSGWAVTA